MPRLIKPNNNAVRKMSFGDFGGLSKVRPFKKLTTTLSKHGGRDKSGKISVRHQGGGAKRLYRIIDFKFMPFEGSAKVITIEYDPNRSAFIALVEKSNTKEKVYILAPDGLKVDDVIYSGATKKFTIGSRQKLADIPVGYDVYNVELYPGRGGQFVRSAGSWGTLTAKEGKYAYLRLPSSEVRKVLLECMASIGKVSNTTHNRVRIAKAGRVRHMGMRPSVRGKAMAPNSHPHGGGEGLSPIGMKHPKTPWGKPALGFRTRRNKRTTKFIITRRKKK
ncbi:50S ribosomal protein L2 [Candidatus Berkelbacteria bacterium]|nr:50S ribosomal protein L2 [Candidatus Berkelbacteria bacterium]